MQPNKSYKCLEISKANIFAPRGSSVKQHYNVIIASCLIILAKIIVEEFSHYLEMLSMVNDKLLEKLGYHCHH